MILARENADCLFAAAYSEICYPAMLQTLLRMIRLFEHHCSGGALPLRERRGGCRGRDLAESLDLLV